MSGKILDAKERFERAQHLAKMHRLHATPEWKAKMRKDCEALKEPEYQAVINDLLNDCFDPEA